MMPIVGFSGCDFQTRDHACSSNQANKGFVAKEIFGLLDFLAFLGFDLALVLGSPAGVWIMRAFFFPFVLYAVANSFPFLP